MALHANFLKHNILRVSKLKKLSHTTQAFERNFDQNSILNGTHLRNATDKTKQNGITKQESDPPLLSLSTSASSGQLLLPMGIAQELLSQIAAFHKERALCQPTRPSLEVVAIRKLDDDNKSSLDMTPYPLDCLPIAKQVSYTADDIIARPMAADCKWLGSGIISYQNDFITVLTERQSALCADIDLPGCGVVKPKDSESETAAADSVASKPNSNTRHCGHHTICDSYPVGSEVRLFDSDTVMCTAGPVSQTLHCSGTAPKGSAGGGGEGGPNLDQLRSVEAYFMETLPTFFKKRLDYRWFHPEIVFENNFWGENEVTVGINQYAVQMTKLRALTHLKYAHVHMEVVSSACIPEEGVIRIQWRIVGISQLKALRFWRYTAWSYNKSFNEDAEWISGISIVHVNKDGVVVKHRIDRVMPDEDQAVKATSLAAKLALLLGLSTPKPSLSDFSSLLCRG